MDINEFKTKYNFIFKFIKVINIKYPNLLPFQNKLFFKQFPVNFNLLSNEIDNIISYYHYIAGVEFNNYINKIEETNLDLSLIKNVNNISNDSYDFHLLCKLKNKCWLYIHIRAEYTFILEDDCAIYDDCRIYMHDTINELIKYGIETKHYSKLGIKNY
jgi:hypothetical protein